MACAPPGLPGSPTALLPPQLRKSNSGAALLAACRVVDGNELSGPIPASWVALPALEHLYMQPGNPELCTDLPSGADFQLCTQGDLTCLGDVQPSNNSACGSGGSSSSGDLSSSGGKGGSGPPVLAIAVPVAVVTALAAAGAGFVWLRRRGRRLRQARQWDKCNPGGDGGAVAIPPTFDLEAMMVSRGEARAPSRAFALPATAQGQLAAADVNAAE